MGTNQVVIHLVLFASRVQISATSLWNRLVPDPADPDADVACQDALYDSGVERL